MENLEIDLKMTAHIQFNGAWAIITPLLVRQLCFNFLYLLS